MTASRGSGIPAPLFVFAAIVSVQFGSALAATLIRQLGPDVTVALRLSVASLILLVVVRPSLRRRPAAAWRAALALGVAFAVMNFSFYAAIARLPLGVTVTVEFLGPLAVAAFASRRLRDFAAVVLALIGVVAVSGILQTDWTSLDLLGLALAGGAGAAWAGYILATRSVGARWAQLDGLAVAITVGAILVAPVALANLSQVSISPGQLAVGASIALLGSVIPYSLELAALRRIDARVFGILMSLEPAVAALFGLLLLGQAMAPLEILGMACVIVASAIVMVGQPAEPITESAEIV